MRPHENSVDPNPVGTGSTPRPTESAGGQPIAVSQGTAAPAVPITPYARSEYVAIHPTALAVDLATAAGMLGICTATVRREIDRGKLRAVRIGRVYRVRVAELHAYLKRLENAC